MKYSHWEMLLLIYSNQLKGFEVLEWQYNKNLMKTCIKNKWVKVSDQQTVIVTDKGLEDATLFFAPLYEIDTVQIGQTF